MDRKKALVVDLNNIWNKYLFARKGVFGPAIFSILALFRSIYQSKQFTKVYIVLDGKPDNKYEIFKDYKANRQKNPDKYIPLKLIVSVLSQYFEVVGGQKLEGDDVTASLARRLVSKYDTYIFSNDKDFIQLMQYGINIVTRFKNGCLDEVLSEEEALNKFKDSKGVALIGLHNVLPYRTFKGDSSDGIPSACSKMKDKDIREFIYNCWIHEEEITEDLLKVMLEATDNKSIHKFVQPNLSNIVRNYNLMNLCSFSDDFVKSIRRFNYKLDVDGLQMYSVRPEWYKW